MKTKPFKDVLKRLALLTGDYREISDDDYDELSDWASLLSARIVELWEEFDWNELCNIEEIKLTQNENFKYFELPEGKIFLAAYDDNPMLFDVDLPPADVRQFEDKIRVPSYFKETAFVRLQKTPPTFTKETPVPTFLEDASVELAYSDILAQNGQLSKSQVRRNFGYEAFERAMARQTKVRRKTINIRK
ncbi:MAG: hypothetical protein J6K91_05860 [Opitutales bacterium]|nr:hypothetical protein [Opitutales bacterium]